MGTAANRHFRLGTDMPERVDYDSNQAHTTIEESPEVSN